MGSFFFVIGCIAIAVPGLPTTPFLLLAAALYVKSSDKLYQKLISNRLLGGYITHFQKHRGMTLKAKLTSISIMWTMITISFIISDTVAVKIALPILGGIGTVVMGFCLKTIKNR